MRRAAGAVALAALAVLLLLAPGAGAHALLEGSEPARGATAATQPDGVTLRFSESVEAHFGAVRVFDAAGRRVDDDRLTHPGGAGSQLRTGLEPGLPDGSYTATYRVVSADGHPVSGGVVFSIGKAGTAPAATVAELLGDAETGPLTHAAAAVFKGLVYVATALALGGLLFLAWCWRPALGQAAGADARWRAASEAFASRARAVLLGAVVLGLVAGALGLAAHAATAGGTSLWAALAPGPIREVAGTRVGAVDAWRLVVWLALGAAVLAAAPARRIALRPATLGAEGLLPARVGPLRAASLAVPAAVLCVLPAFAGHAAVQDPAAVLVALDVLHVAAMSAWIGGLAALLFVVSAATRRLDPPDRSRLLAALLARFSPVALAAVVLLAATGTVQAILHVERLSALTGTAYGREVIAKVALLAVLIGLGAVQRRRSVPGLRATAEGGAAPGLAGRRLRRVLQLEVGLVVVVLGVTSVLVGTPPPTAVANGPYSGGATVGAVRFELTVDPARPGPAAMHIYLFDAKSGAAATGSAEVTAAATLPARGIGPLDVRLQRAGPGHFVAIGLSLPGAGDWKLRVTDRLSEFDELTHTFTVPVR